MNTILQETNEKVLTPMQKAKQKYSRIPEHQNTRTPEHQNIFLYFYCYGLDFFFRPTCGFAFCSLCIAVAGDAGFI